MRCPLRIVLLSCVLTSLAACQRAPETAKAPLTQPASLVGRWVRLRDDGTWGDTLDYRPDGRVLGSQGHEVPPSARWGVRPGPLGSQELCAADATVAYCQTFRFVADTMLLGGGPRGPTRFRRAGGA